MFNKLLLRGTIIAIIALLGIGIIFKAVLIFYINANRAAMNKQSVKRHFLL
ncbi:MAG: hypothetical protein ACJAVV_000338 [Alphaproteobacteria bacterium]|jgi:hypothetical protein